MILSEVDLPELDLEVVDRELMVHHRNGLEVRSMILNASVILAMVHWAEAHGCVVRAPVAVPSEGAVMGVAVAGYLHPITGESVKLFSMPSWPDHRISFSTEVATEWLDHPDAPYADRFAHMQTDNRSGCKH